VIRRLGTADATGWFLRQIPFARPGRVLVRRARVESTPTSHQTSPAASAKTCNAVRIRADIFRATLSAQLRFRSGRCG